MYEPDRPCGFNGSTGCGSRPVDGSAGAGGSPDGAGRSNRVGQAASSWRSRGVATGEEALDGALQPGRALGQRLHVLAESGDVGLDFGQVRTDFRSKVLHVCSNLGSERRHVGA